MKKNEPQVITVLEPTWNDHVHLPGNLGLLRIVRNAYPDAKLNYVGGEGQLRLIREAAIPELEGVHLHPWRVGQDRDTLPIHVFRATRRLKSLPSAITTDASILVYCSITPTSLNALNLLGLADKTMLMLHGNANDLDGWRSRNPLRRYFDLRSTMERFGRQRGTTLALEERIVNNLKSSYPWLSGNIHCLPHPLTPEEAAPEGDIKPLKPPIRIGFAGNASIDKGFADFARFATELSTLRPGQFEFHAIGRLAKDAASIDQTALTTPAGAEALPRKTYVSQLRNMHYLFVWHRDNYYGNAASGVVYDAINLCIPLISRKTEQFSAWQQAGIDMALTFDDLTTAILYVSQLGDKDDTQYIQQIDNLSKLRASFGINNLSARFKEIVDSTPVSSRYPS